MRNTFLLVFTMMAIGTAGQAQNNDSTAPRRIQLGINFSADADYRTLRNSDGSSTSGFVMGLNNNNERPKFGFTTGLNICYSVGKRFGLEGGIQYSNKGYQTKMMELIYAQPEAGLPSGLKSIYNFHYIDVPLKVNFTAGKGNTRFFASAGITTNFFITEIQTNIRKYSDGSRERKSEATTYNYNKVNLSPVVSVGIDHKINDKMNFRIEPTFRYGILGIIDEPITGYLWNVGLNVGYYFRPDFLYKKK